MDKKRILVFPAGTEIAFEILNGLKFSKFVELYGANSVPSHAEFVFKNCVTNLPFENDPNFIEALNLVIDKYKIDYVYPAHDNACLTLTRKQQFLHAKVITSPLETVEICRSKIKTYNFFKDASFLPKIYHTPEEIKSYPVFIKPSVGQGSVGAQKIKSKKELSEVINNGREYVICEFLPGNEYTVDCFSDRHGQLLACHLRIRERIKTGISVRSSLLPTDANILEIANEINNRLVFNGAWFFQVKKNSDGEYRLMEISPRIPGTMGTSRNLGINYPLLTLYNMLDSDIEIIDNKAEITLDRAFISRYKTNVKYKKVFMDFDDTLCIGGKVNILMISFLYQCANKGIPVVMITKHQGDIQKSLKQFKISEKLFSQIIKIEKEEDKCKYIVDRDCILIDDSFAERKNARDKLGIAVFDLDMIECLMDWRM